MSNPFNFISGVLKNESLKSHCSFGVGGAADFFYVAKKLDDLLGVLKVAVKNNINVFILAGGTNVLFGDKGFRGLVVKNQINNFEILDGFVRVSSGVMMPVLVHKLVEANLSGLERFSGLPGTVGGAVFGNAGCNGLEIKDVLVSSEILNLKTGDIKTVDNDYFNFEYRKSVLRNTNEIVLSATFKVSDGVDLDAYNALNAKLLNYRRTRQPSGKTNGSWFKNPSKDLPAGLLIDRVGLKGHKIGGAQISDIHANFFMNVDNATASDILALSDLAVSKVFDEFGVELEKEVRLVGEF